jgi:hypothetical protein
MAAIAWYPDNSGRLWNGHDLVYVYTLIELFSTPILTTASSPRDPTCSHRPVSHVERRKRDSRTPASSANCLLSIPYVQHEYREIAAQTENKQGVAGSFNYIACSNLRQAARVTDVGSSSQDVEHAANVGSRNGDDVWTAPESKRSICAVRWTSFPDPQDLNAKILFKFRQATSEGDTCMWVTCKVQGQSPGTGTGRLIGRTASWLTEVRWRNIHICDAFARLKIQRFPGFA